ncbi:FAD-dependent monooxygenase [Granulicoccus sp. GXG6511]|uniref:FAD-dependent monooxygenase n=1 Tax=Granulicoccus sp. GXG6511 TaxID=3381351 RepID=UPI003D7D26EB
MTQDFDTDVIVVGAGPMGGTTALALATYGVRVLTISRWNWVAHSPRAHVMNQRALEVFRDLGIEEEAKAAGTPWELMGDHIFATSLTGPEVARLRTWGTGDERRTDYLLGSPCGLLDLGQPLMEPIVVSKAAARGAVFRFGVTYLGHEQDADGVTVRMVDEVTGMEFTQRARFLVGADGARSQIAEEIGLEIVGQQARAGQIYAMFHADLTELVAHRPSILHYLLQPATGFGELGLGVLRAVRPWDQWMAGWGFDQTKGEPDLDEQRAADTIRTLVGDPDLRVNVQWVSPWYVNQQYATDYSRGRVFCGGDAVHRHPPSSGLGSNTCIQDAFNLGWKLAYVVKGYAGLELLQTYSDERAPVGKQIVERANQSRFDYAPLRAAFAAEGDDPVAAGVAKLRDRSPEGAAARAELQAAMDLKNYEFNAQGVELNQRYVSTAVVPDQDAPEVFARDPQLYLQATTRPGAKLPHAWLVNRDGRRTSTLDITGRGIFSLVTGLSGQAWVEAAWRSERECLRTIVIGEDDYQDLYGAWARVREIDEAGAVLVRPDGYVAWRCSDAVFDPKVATRMLADVLDRVLGAPIPVGADGATSRPVVPRTADLPGGPRERSLGEELGTL